MSRLEFMKELARLLDDLPKEEKIEILKYYNGYFDDAGQENEAAIIEELGSPAKVAASVKAGMDEKLAEQMEFTEKGADDEKIVHEYEERRSQNDRYGDGGQSSRGGDSYEDSRAYHYDEDRRAPRRSGSWGRGWIIFLLIVTFPAWIGLAGGLFGGLMGLIGGLIGLCVGVVASLVAFVASGAASIVGGFGKLFFSPLSGMMSIAVGILFVGIGLFFLVLCGLVFGKLVPAAFRGIGKLFRSAGRLFGRRNEA